MDNIIGPPVEGDNFKFRDKEVKEIIDLLSVGNSVLMTGIRRIGKSSVMKGVCDKAPDEWIKAYHDLQGMKNPSDFFSVLLKSIPKRLVSHVYAFWSQAKSIPPKIVDFVTSTFTKLGAAGVSVEMQKYIVDYWTPLTEGIEFVLKKEKRPALFALDEFPIFVENMLASSESSAIVEHILRQMKEWRNNIPHFSLLIGGSISLDCILSRHNISGGVIGDIARYYLPPLDKEQAKSLLNLLAGSHELQWYDEEKIEETLNILDEYYPFFLQAFFFQIRSKGGPDGPSLTNIFENYFIPSIRKPFFGQFLDRLKKNYTEKEKKLVSKILDLISGQKGYKTNYSLIRNFASKRGMERTDLYVLLENLISDEFLVRDSLTFEYAFANKLVAKWWCSTS